MRLRLLLLSIKEIGVRFDQAFRTLPGDDIFVNDNSGSYQAEISL
jgi:hypothetical protein